MRAKGKERSWLTIIGWAALVGYFYWLTSPSGEQVCRQSRVPVLDWVHGIDGQPTCQQLIKRISAQAARAESRANELETRTEELEMLLAR